MPSAILDDTVRTGMRTPWGTAQTARLIVPGIGVVSTAGHGGLKVAKHINAKIPDYLRQQGGWYEEDCDAAVALVVLAPYLGDHEYAQSDRQASMRKSFMTWYPDEYETFFGVKLEPGQSRIRDEKVFLQANQDAWIAVAAYGGWHERVPAGMTGVVCTKGGGRTQADRAAERQFLVPADGYKAAGPFGYVVDLATAQEVGPFRD